VRPDHGASAAVPTSPETGFLTPLVVDKIRESRYFQTVLDFTTRHPSPLPLCLVLAAMAPGSPALGKGKPVELATAPSVVYTPEGQAPILLHAVSATKDGYGLLFTYGNDLHFVGLDASGKVVVKPKVVSLGSGRPGWTRMLWHEDRLVVIYTMGFTPTLYRAALDAQGLVLDEPKALLKAKSVSFACTTETCTVATFKQTGHDPKRPLKVSRFKLDGTVDGAPVAFDVKGHLNKLPVSLPALRVFVDERALLSVVPAGNKTLLFASLYFKEHKPGGVLVDPVREVLVRLSTKGAPVGKPVLYRTQVTVIPRSHGRSSMRTIVDKIRHGGQAGLTLAKLPRATPLLAIRGGQGEKPYLFNQKGLGIIRVSRLPKNGQAAVKKIKRASSRAPLIWKREEPLMERLETIRVASPWITSGATSRLVPAKDARAVAWVVSRTKDKRRPSGALGFIQYRLMFAPLKR